MARKRTRTKKTTSTAEQQVVVHGGLDFTDFSGFDEYNKIVMTKFTEALKEEHFKPRKYTREQITNFLTRPESSESSLRQVSQYLYLTSSHYRRLLNYFANMLTFDYVIVPIMVPGQKMTGDQFRRNYEAASWYLELVNPKHEFAKIVSILLMDGVFFGVEWQTKDSFLIQRLPTDFCRISGVEDNTWTFAFNFDYFSGNNEEKLANYPSEFTTKFRAFQRDRSLQWQELDPSTAVCFKFDESMLVSIPPFTGVFEDIFDIADYKALAISKTRLENYKLLVQKIPYKKDPRNEKDFLISYPSVKVFHNAIKRALPDQVGLVSTPMEIEDFNFEKARQQEDTVGMAQRNYYGNAGVSNMLFNAEKSGSVGLNRSIQVDEADMFKILRQFEAYLKKRLTTKITKGAYQMKALLPDITVYNRDDMFDKYMKSAEYGFPASLVAATLGYSPTDLITLKNLETNYMDLSSIMIPLSSSHTASPGDEGGRPTKGDTEISESGEQTKDSGANEEKAQ